MTVKIIPKEQLTAYQRWELGGLDTPQDDPPAQAPEPATEHEPSPVALPTAEELERLHQTAWQEAIASAWRRGVRKVSPSAAPRDRPMSNA